MPNHVQSIITISGTKESVERVKKRILVDYDYIWNIKTRNTRVGDRDFSLPIPEVGELSFNRLIPTPTNIYQGMLSNVEEEKYGKENCWDDWNRKHWGTKWDAYEVEIQMLDDCTMQIMFQTAWNAPLPYMKELAKVCIEEGCDMNGKFCDEDFASNMGIFFINEDNEFYLEWHDEDAELYEKCWGWNPLENDDEFDDVDDEDENN